MKFEIDIPKELFFEMESYAKAEGITVKEFSLLALGEKVGGLREKLGLKNLTHIIRKSLNEKQDSDKNILDPDKPKPLLKANEVAKYLQISKSAAYHLMKTGELQIVKFGRSVRVREEDLESYIYKSRK